MTDPIGERVARLEALLPEIRDELRELRHLLTERVEAAEERINSLERWLSYLLGVGAAIGTAVGLLSRKIMDWLRGN